MQKKSKIKILKIVLYMCGIFCIVYPLYSKFISYKNQTEVIYDYKKEVENMDQLVLEEKKKKSDEFNKDNSIETAAIDPNSINTNENVTSSYSFLEVGEIIGYISIPKINIELPIYEGVTINNLSKGVAHMENTSLPNGNYNTHAVLAGHTGISNAVFFDNLNELDIDDEFSVTFYGDTTKYKIVDESVVLPEDTTSLKVEEGRCLVTLVTCTPKSVNTHRLLVTGEKIEEEVHEENINEIIEDTATQIEEKTDLELFIDFIKINKDMFIFIILIIILLLVIGLISKIRRKIRDGKRSE